MNIDHLLSTCLLIPLSCSVHLSFWPSKPSTEQPNITHTTYIQK
jgi:hypothetical protein